MSINDLCLHQGKSAKEALIAINTLGIPNLALFIVDDDNSLIGSISDGDIRRGLLEGYHLDQKVEDFMNLKVKFFIRGENNYQKFDQYKKLGIRFIPMVSMENQIIIDIIDLDTYKAIIPADAIIMAGGRGERLSPMTDTVPKPMLHVGDKPIIKWNIDRLKEHGIQELFITVRHLKELIIDGLKSDIDESYFVSEDKPLGTIGAIKLIENIKNDTVILMNSDILTNLDFDEFYSNFISTDSDIQIATIPYNVTIPYGVIEIEEQTQRVQGLKEKPRYTYYTNAGIYIFKKSLIELIPNNTKFDATDFIELLIGKGYKVTSFPMYCYWLDIGQPEDFYKAQEDVKHIEF